MTRYCKSCNMVLDPKVFSKCQCGAVLCPRCGKMAGYQMFKVSKGEIESI